MGATTRGEWNVRTQATCFVVTQRPARLAMTRNWRRRPDQDRRRANRWPVPPRGQVARVEWGNDLGRRFVASGPPVRHSREGASCNSGAAQTAAVHQREPLGPGTSFLHAALRGTGRWASVMGPASTTSTHQGACGDVGMAPGVRAQCSRCTTSRQALLRRRGGDGTMERIAGRRPRALFPC